MTESQERQLERRANEAKEALKKDTTKRNKLKDACKKLLDDLSNKETAA